MSGTATGPLLPPHGADEAIIASDTPGAGHTAVLGHITVTFFFNYAAATKREETVSIDALAERIRTTTEREKARLPWLKLARFGDAKTDKDSLRHDANMLAITGIEADYDGEQTSFEAAEETLAQAGLFAILYTSPSHTEDTPRWRVLCPLSQEYPPAERDHFMARLNGLFGAIFSRESWVWSQSYYFGAVNRNPSHRVAKLDGIPIDQADELAATAIGLPEKPKPASNGSNGQHVDDPAAITDKRIAGIIESLLDNIRNAADGAKHFTLWDNALAIGGYLHLTDWSDEQAVEKCMTVLPATVNDWNLARRTAAQAIAAGRTKPLTLANRPEYASRRKPPPQPQPGGGGGGSAPPPPPPPSDEPEPQPESEPEPQPEPSAGGVGGKGPEPTAPATDKSARRGRGLFPDDEPELEDLDEPAGEEAARNNDDVADQRDDDHQETATSDFERAAAAIERAKPENAAAVVIDLLLKSPLPPIEEEKLIQIAAARSKLSTDGTHANVHTITRQLKEQRAEVDKLRWEEAKQRGRQQQADTTPYHRTLAAIEAANAEDVVQILINALSQPDHGVTSPQVILLVKAAEHQSGIDVATIRSCLRQAEQDRQQAQLEQQRERKQKAIADAKRTIIDEFNSKYFMANETGKAMIWQPTRDPMLNDRIYYQRSKPSDLRTFYLNRLIQVGEAAKGKPVLRNAADIWLEHTDRKQFINGVVFDPSGTDRPGVFNLWREFPVTPKQGSWKLMQDHLLDIVCVGNRQHYDYLRKWLARAVQFPGKPGEVAIVTRGLKGVGKSILGVAMCRIFGQHGFPISNSVHLVGKFNQHLRDCIVLFADEAFFPGDRQHIGVLNAIITQPYLTIEGKGKDTVLAPNCVHLIMASNEDWIVPASPKDERRYFVLDVLADKKGDRPYFTALWNELENGGLEAMLYDLQREDLNDFSHRDIPDTAGLLRQQRLSLPTKFLWWEDVLHRGYVWASKLGLEDYFGKWHNVITMDVLCNSYAEFAKARHERHRLSRERLGQFIVEMGGKATRPRDEVVGEHLADVANPYGGTTRKAELVKHPRPHAYDLGSLTEARVAFDTATGLRMEWPPDPAAPIEAFIKAECAIAPEVGVRADTLFGTWVTWCTEQKIDPGSLADFDKAVREAVPSIDIVPSPDGDGGTINYYQGIQLN